MQDPNRYCYCRLKNREAATLPVFGCVYEGDRDGWVWTEISEYLTPLLQTIALQTEDRGYQMFPL